MATEKKPEKENSVTGLLDYVLILFLEKKKGKCFCTLKIFYFCKLTLKLTFNNVLLVVSNSEGSPVIFLSAGVLGLRNSQKTTPLATRSLSLHLFELLQELEGATFHINLIGYGTRLRVFFSELRVFFRQQRNMELM